MAQSEWALITKLLKSHITPPSITMGRISNRKDRKQLCIHKIHDTPKDSRWPRYRQLNTSHLFDLGCKHENTPQKDIWLWVLVWDVRSKAIQFIPLHSKPRGNWFIGSLIHFAVLKGKIYDYAASASSLHVCSTGTFVATWLKGLNISQHIIKVTIEGKQPTGEQKITPTGSLRETRSTRNSWQKLLKTHSTGNTRRATGNWLSPRLWDVQWHPKGVCTVRKHVRDMRSLTKAMGLQVGQPIRSIWGPAMGVRDATCVKGQGVLNKISICKLVDVGVGKGVIVSMSRCMEV